MILGVNIDHVATLREGRKATDPEPLMAATLAVLGGADGITVHLREDRRHIRDRDLSMLREMVGLELNLEMAATEQHLAATRPWLQSPIRVHTTGSPPPSLDGVVAILFLLCDPLKENYPDCFAEAVAIADEGRSRGVKLLNPPENLSNSVKSRQAELWQRAGIPPARPRARSARRPTSSPRWRRSACR